MQKSTAAAVPRRGRTDECMPLDRTSSRLSIPRRMHGRLWLSCLQQRRTVRPQPARTARFISRVQARSFTCLTSRQPHQPKFPVCCRCPAARQGSSSPKQALLLERMAASTSWAEASPHRRNSTALLESSRSTIQSAVCGSTARPIRRRARHESRATTGRSARRTGWPTTFRGVLRSIGLARGCDCCHVGSIRFSQHRSGVPAAASVFACHALP